MIAVDDFTAELTSLNSGPQELVWKNGVRHGLAAEVRYAAFLDWHQGVLAGEGGGILTFVPRAPLAEILATVALMPPGRRPRTIYLTGPDLAAHRPPWPTWYQDVVPAGWSITRTSGDHSWDCEREGCRVSIRQSHEWFDDEADARSCAASWRTLRRQLTGTFGLGAYLYPNPTQTGKYLLQLSLPFGREYPVLPDGLRELLYDTQSQGRFEVLPLTGRDELPSVQVLDGRWMYASCTSNLPSGRWIYDAEDCYGGYSPGFYRVRARVPAHWDHIGLLGLRDEQSGHMVYPNTPGCEFVTWCSGAELPKAIEKGWIMRFERRVLWPEKSTDPLGRFTEKLKRLRSAAETHGEANLKAAYRNLLMRTVGALNSRESREEGYVTTKAALQKLGELRNVRQVPGGYKWERSYLTVSESSHPEWAATIWGRTRAKLVKAALQLPRETLVALRLDGIWVTEDPGWPDTHQPGAWRIKETLGGPVAQPRTGDQADALAARLHGRGE